MQFTKFHIHIGLRRFAKLLIFFFNYLKVRVYFSGAGVKRKRNSEEDNQETKIVMNFWKRKDTATILLKSLCKKIRELNDTQMMIFVKQYYCMQFQLRPTRCCAKIPFCHCLIRWHSPEKWNISVVLQDYNMNFSTL